MNCFFKKIFVSVCLMSLVGVCFAVSEDEVAKITSAAPDKAAVEPKQQRKILVFNFCQGFKMNIENGLCINFPYLKHKKSNKHEKQRNSRNHKSYSRFTRKF